MQIHFIGGEKGGVGKTFVSRCLVQYFLLKTWDFHLIEADAAIADVSSVFQDASTITLSDHPHRYAEPDIIFEKARQKTVIVNLPSNTQGVLHEWMRQTNLLNLSQDYQVSVMYWFVTDGCFASVKLLQRSLAEFNHAIPHLLVRNRGRLNGVDFTYLDHDMVYQKAIQAKNLLRVLDFPVLGSAEQYFIDRHDLRLQEAQARATEELGIIPSQRIKSFIDEMVKVFDQVNFELGSGSTEGQAAKSKVRTSNGIHGIAPATTPQPT
jgi:hypothetical protein